MKKIICQKQKKRNKRRIRIRVKILGTGERPRLAVFRSNKFIYAQLIDDVKKRTITGVDEKKLKITQAISKTEKAKIVGQKLAETAFKNKIKEVVFDRSGYKYHGRVKALAEGARAGGLKL